ncbi:MAG: PqqD family protein [Pseudobutyrivibrio sp.]|nr:PqqD family protein [Pseudobutyrivibrio sp.]
MASKKDNFLEYVFKIKEDLHWSTGQDGQVTVDMENKGFTNRLAQKFFHKPPVSHIELEGMGSFIFGCIDGKRSVYDIGLLVHEEFKDQAEPLYERLSVYMKQLENLGFIEKS